MIRGLLVVLLAILWQTAAADEAADELSRQATDPTASLMALNLISNYVGDYHGSSLGLDDSSWDLSFRPVIPFTAFGKANILRMTIPYRVDGRGQHGLGSVSIFDLVVTNQSWGRWGVGVVATLSADDVAPDKFVLGPAIGAVWKYSDTMNLGLFNQNVFGGDTAITQIQPIIAYQLGSGWSLSAGDLQWVYDWKASRWKSLPVGVQLGKVSRIGGQPVRFAINPQYDLADFDGAKRWSVILTFAVLVPSS